MRNKKLLSVLLIGILAFTLGIGTMALYTRTFSSDNNAVKTSKFKVSSNGTLDDETKFNVLDLRPGVDIDVHEFVIDLHDTEVPVKYDLSVLPEGAVFRSRNGNPSPIELTIFRKVDGEWTSLNGLDNIEIIPEKRVEEFKLNLTWPHNDEIDADFEDLSGHINIRVIAQQIEDAKEVEPTVKVLVYPDASYRKNKRIGIEVENIKGADQYEIEYLSGGRMVRTERVKIGEEAQKCPSIPITVREGNIRIYNRDGRLLHVFEGVSLLPQIQM